VNLFRATEVTDFQGFIFECFSSQIRFLCIYLRSRTTHFKSPTTDAPSTVDIRLSQANNPLNTTKRTSLRWDHTAGMEKKPGDLEGLAEASGKVMEEESDTALIPKDPAPADVPKPKESVPTEDVPDPDEDDLDDLDGKSPT
jgi:hypothetical protein